MIEIKSIKDAAIIKQHCLENNVVFDENTKMNALMDKNEIQEFLIFFNDHQKGEVVFVSNLNNNYDFQNSLIKAFMFSMGLKGIKTVLLPLSYSRFAKELGYKKADDKYILNLEDYNFCSCKNQN